MTPQRDSVTAGSRREFLARLAAVGLATQSPSLLVARADDGRRKMIRVRPAEYPHAFANPLKGFRPDIPSPDGGSGRGLDNPLVTVARHYIRWNQIEDSASDGVDAIREFCNPRWAGLERRNLKIIPRVYLYWPEQYFWPRDLRAGDYGSRKFLHRLEQFILKLGEAWNKDGRIAYVETGIVGPCGEQWGPTPHWELRKVMGDTYQAAFPDKLCMIRYPWQWPEYRFGVFWDSWGTHKDTDHMLEVLESPELADSWKTRVRGGEISYGFGEPPGDDPNDAMAKSVHSDWIECLVRRGHWNHLGWVAEYDWKRPASVSHGERLQKAFGYRFVLEEVNYSASVNAGEKLEVSFTVRNTGSSPFYYNWPVTACLLDERTRKCVWQERFPNVDLRQWLPGDRWMQFADWNVERKHYVLNQQPARYEIAPVAHRIYGQFALPRQLRRGVYTLALAILDPASGTPACRFANQNYFRGGWHPIGRIGVRQEISNAELAAEEFDDLAADQTIGYAAS
ncbi:MAG TPA: DUF4832 domain-containing protein [Verrucomicrobiae bacterium]|nr:DUF4832 domain-containing protein [Verrucomicrobiae bacterium]